MQRAVHQRLPLRSTRRRARLLVATALSVGLLAGACGDDDDVAEAKDKVGDAGSTSLARTQAESLRALIKAKGDGNADKYISVALLSEAARELPGDTKVNEIVDANGDGKDDDGKMEVVVNNATVCVSIKGTNTEVDAGACS